MDLLVHSHSDVKLVENKYFIDIRGQMTTTLPVLRTERLGRSVGQSVLVSDVTMEVRRGEVLAVVGPSGAGKSSFLRLLNRLDEPTGGSFVIEGRDYKEFPARELRQRVGLVMQTPFLFPGTVETNLQFGPAQRGRSLGPSEITSLLERVGLFGYERRDVSTLSGGEAQRVSVARALANDPVLLLLDEPTSALHEEAKMGVEQLLLEIVRTSHLTCVVVTHDRAQAARMADRVMVMKSGRMQKIGTVAEVLGA